MQNLNTNTYQVDIHITGNLIDIQRICQEHCMKGGCVNVMPTDFIFTGGKESGAKIGLINYARFPSTDEEIKDDGMKLAKKLLIGCYQRSCSIVTPTTTYFLSNDKIEMKR